MALRDAVPPPQPAGPLSPRLRIVVRCLRRHRLRLRMGGPDVDWIRDTRWHVRRPRVSAHVTLTDFRVVTLRARRRC